MYYIINVDIVFKFQKFFWETVVKTGMKGSVAARFHSLKLILNGEMGAKTGLSIYKGKNVLGGQLQFSIEPPLRRTLQLLWGMKQMISPEIRYHCIQPATKRMIYTSGLYGSDLKIA